MARLLDYLPRGNTLDDEAWHRRHLFLQWVLGLHLPALFVFGVLLGNGALTTFYVLVVPAICLAVGHVIKQRRPASILITAGLTYCSAALVGLSAGSIEAHFHFFIMIGFIALYQDWVPFLWNILFTVVSHGLGSVWTTSLIFNHPYGQTNPWVWSGIHGAAVLFACVGMVIFWRVTEDEQMKRAAQSRELADAEIGRRKFTSDLLVNLARRNQSMLYRQLDIINALEEKERDPDALAELFHLDHLATRVRRNAESLLVLSGEKPARVWSAPVPLRDVVRAAIAETEDLDRVDFIVDERAAVSGQTVTDLTHLLAELTENAVRFSPPESRVTIRTRPYVPTPDAYLLTIEDTGVGLPPDELAAANQLLADPPEVDLSASQRLGFHVVARLARRHDISVSLTPTPGCGITAVVLLPPALFATAPPTSTTPAAMPAAAVPPTEPANHHVTATAPIAMVAAMPDAGTAERSPVPAQAMAPVLEHSNGIWTADDDAWAGWWYAAAQEHPDDTAGAAGSDGSTAAGFGLPPAASLASAQPEPGAPAPDASAPAANGHSAGEVGSASRPSPERRLNRRVPQSHLAPELRVAPSDMEASPPVHAERASEALSRYQASRQAAQAPRNGWQDSTDKERRP